MSNDKRILCRTVKVLRRHFGVECVVGRIEVNDVVLCIVLGDLWKRFAVYSSHGVATSHHGDHVL